jgi:membrane-bound inhibitor of C-type lysozyme
MRKTPITIVGSLLLPMALACTDAPPREGAPSPPESASKAATPHQTTSVEGWWELGDSAGLFTAEQRGDEIIAVQRDLSHGEYGATRDRFDFESGNLVRYSQDSELRLMDPDDPSRLVPVTMRLEFGSSGALHKGEKAVDGVSQEVEAADVDRVLVQVEPLIERVQAFAHALGGATETVRFACSEDRSFAVTFAGDDAVLDLGPGCGRFVVTRQPSASGARYGDGRFVFWTKGEEGLVERFGEEFLSGCQVAD